MRTEIAYCSACDQDVRIVITDEPTADDGQAPIHDAEVVCLEIGDRCTGSLCPIGATSPVVMAARLVRSGLHTKVHPVVRALCPACDRVTECVIIDKNYATCSECGCTSPRAELKFE